MLKRLLCSLALLVIMFVSSAAAVRADITPQALQGIWSGSNGQDMMILMFQGNACALGLNGQQMAGVYSLSGNRLFMQFQNGRSISYALGLEGDTLVLDGSVRLARQNAPAFSQPSWGAGSGAQPGGTWGGGSNDAQPGGSWGGGSNGAPQGGTWGGGSNGAQPGGSWGGAPQAERHSILDGTWSVMLSQGKRSFRFTGNRYAQLINAQMVEEGLFSVTPDGRFSYQVTSGNFTGVRGENRIQVTGNSLTMTWPEGNSLTFVREDAQNQGQGIIQAPGAQTPLEGRWIWAKSAPQSFGYLFSGNHFIFYWNGQERSRGTFTLTKVQLIMHHESGPDSGKTDNLAYQLHGNRLLIYTRADQDPIPFVRQN